MADIADLANDYVEEFLTRALVQRQRNLSAAVSAEFCVDCDEPIPLPRQQAIQGCETCVECQQLREMKRV